MHQAFGLPAGVVTYTDEEGDKIALDSEGEGEEGRVSFTCTADVHVYEAMACTVCTCRCS